jgi:hypothetical protein
MFSGLDEAETPNSEAISGFNFLGHTQFSNINVDSPGTSAERTVWSRSEQEE